MITCGALLLTAAVHTAAASESSGSSADGKYKRWKKLKT